MAERSCTRRSSSTMLRTTYQRGSASRRRVSGTMAAPSEAASSIRRSRRPRSCSAASASSSPREAEAPEGEDQRLHLHEGRPARLPAGGHEGGQGRRVGDIGQELVERLAPLRLARVRDQVAHRADDADGLGEAILLERADEDLAQAAQDERPHDVGTARGHVEQRRDDAPLDGVVALGVGTEGVGVRGHLDRDRVQVHRRLLGQQRAMVLGVVAVHVLLAEQGRHLREVRGRLGQRPGRRVHLLVRLGQRLGHLERVARELPLLAGQATETAEHVGGRERGGQPGQVRARALLAGEGAERGGQHRLTDRAGERAEQLDDLRRQLLPFVAVRALQPIAHQAGEGVRGGHAEAAARGLSAGRGESAAAPAAASTVAAGPPAAPAGAATPGAAASTAGSPSARAAGPGSTRAGPSTEQGGDGLRRGALARPRAVAPRPDGLRGQQRLQQAVEERAAPPAWPGRRPWS